MPSKSKNKGSSFEREIATFLSNLYSESFVRIPNSGAYIGGANTHRKNRLSENQIKSFKGDIVPPDSWVYFNAEAKNYADFPFHQVLTGKCKQLDTWLEQLTVVAEPHDVNFLFFKINRKGRFVCVESRLTWKSDNFFYYSSESHKDWIIIEFDHFWQQNKELVQLYSTSKTSDTKSDIILETSDTKSILNLTSNTLLSKIPI
jgi:hypothetical protein